MPDLRDLVSRARERTRARVRNDLRDRLDAAFPLVTDGPPPAPVEKLIVPLYGSGPCSLSPPVGNSSWVTAPSDGVKSPACAEPVPLIGICRESAMALEASHTARAATATSASPNRRKMVIRKFPPPLPKTRGAPRPP